MTPSDGSAAAGIGAAQPGDRPSASGLSEARRRLLEQRLLGDRAAPIPRRADGQAPASFAQERLWFLDRLDPGGAVYNIPCAIGLEGPLDRAALEGALSAVLDRHEALRTTFPAVDGTPVQRVGPPEPARIPVVDLTGASDEAVARALTAEARRPFDLARGPLVRPALFRTAPSDHVLLLTVHHIAFDGASMGVLFEELSEAYGLLVGGARPARPALAVQYPDYAAWQRAELAAGRCAEDLAYWRARLAGVPPLELAGDRARPARQTYRGARHAFRLPADLSAALRALSRREGATLFMALLAAFQALLARYTGQEDVAVGTPVAGRGRTELEPLIGLFVNTVVLRTDLSGDPAFRELLARVRNVALGALEHDRLPFDTLVADLHPARALGHTPLFQVLFELENTPPEAPPLAGLVTRLVDVPMETAKFDLALIVKDGADGIAGVIEYSAELFDAETIERMAGHLETLCAAAARDPGAPLSALPLLGDAERRRILVEWNDTARDYPRDATVHELFHVEAARRPGDVALVGGDRELTYRELSRRANQLARHLKRLGVGPDVTVAVAMDRSVDLVVALLAVLKADGAYVPLDPAHPIRRIEFMLADSGARVLVTETRLRPSLPAFAGPVVCLDADWAAIAAEDGESPASAAGADNLAYVIYTSGSTGQPKGVGVVHRSIVRLVKNAGHADLGPGEVFAQLSLAGFDISTFEIWGSLLNGARLAVFPPGALSVSELAGGFARHGVTTIFLTPALFNVIVDHDPASFGPVRQILVGGDVLSAPHAARLLRERPGCRLINAYGPTETTAIATAFSVTPDDTTSSVPIGRPIANTRAYVLDAWRRPAPIGVPGELYVGGDALARGYLNRPDITADRFTPDPFSGDSGARLYRTGDRARLRADGNLEFLGRTDDQVKIRGHRVELEEVAAALRQHDGVRDVAVVCRPDAWGDRALVAYVAVGARKGPTADELREHARERLPAHMVPSAFVALPTLPMRPTGKVDREALPEPRQEPAARTGPPQDGVEARLAAMWEELLGIRPVGTSEDFFALGGHSLLAVRLVARVQEAFGVALPLAAVFQAPTVRELANLVRQRPQSERRRALVALKDGGNRPPLFVVPGIGGSVLCLAALARALAADQPVYGLQSYGLDGSPPVLSRLEDIAASFVAEIRAARRDGPYALAGVCMGGAVAWEMAQQLRAAGAAVSLLALLETWPASCAPWLGAARTPPLLRLLASRGAALVRTAAALRGRARLAYLVDRARVAMTAARGELSADARAELDLGQVARANGAAFTRYRPARYAGSVAILRAEDRALPAGNDERLTWGDLADGRVETRWVPGLDSGLMLAEPNVQALAAALQDALDRHAAGSPVAAS